MLTACLLTRMLLYFCEFFEGFIQCALIIFIPLLQLVSDPSPFLYPAFCLVFVLFSPIQFVLPIGGCVVFYWRVVD